MKKTFALFVTLLIAPILFGQNEPKREPFIIKGQITECPEKYLKIFFLDEKGQSLIDTIKLDESGRFYLKTFKVQVPQRTSIQQNNIQINDFFVAPGYNLTITGIGKDFLSLAKSKRISGVGSESNKYRFMLDSILVARMDKTRLFELKENAFLSYVNNYQKLKDSIAKIVFDKKFNKDKFFKYFGSLVNLDNKFNKLSLLVSHVNRNTYSYEKSILFIRNNFDNKILDNLYNDEYLISNDYRGFIGGEWLNYLVTLDFKKDSTLQNQKGYKLKKVNEIYQGKVKEFVLYNRMGSSIEYSNSFEKLNDYKEQFENYFSSLKNQYYKKSLESKIAEKETELLRTQVGKPAPQFTLESNLGKTYNLKDFKDRVVYLDLWASWCSPCRAETPSFKILYEKYKNDKRVAFLSIAVRDGINEWKKALEEDKPDWIQLLDKEGLVWKSYVANSIPKFILIDKQGNIVNFDAPKPSSGEEIEKLLNSEMAK
jgi:thiol-disulfide isomerase/thioredoxin